MSERIEIKAGGTRIMRADWKPVPPYGWSPEQVKATADEFGMDFVFDSNGDAVAHALFNEEVSLEERLRVMQDLTDLYNLRAGVV